MPYGEDITISVGDAVRIHPKYENHKFKKLKYGVTYFVKEMHTDYTKKIRYLETEKGDTILLNMDQTYFEHVGKEEQMEDDEDFQPDYALEVGDVVLIQNSGFGFIGKDKNKYVEVTGHGDYFGGEGVRVRPYECHLETPAHGVVGYGSFGKNPMILFNINDEHMVDEDRVAVAEGSKQEVDKALGINREQYTGSSSDYYKVYVKNPTTLEAPYEAECNDIIESLKMTFAEGNAFKGIWRKAKARQGVKKKGYDNGLYDSEKVVFFGERMVVEAKEGGG